MSRAPILVIGGKFGIGSTEAGLAAGFRASGWGVQEVVIPHLSTDDAEQTVFKIGARLVRSVAPRGYVGKAIQACIDTRADAFLTVKGTYIDLATLDYLRELGVFTTIYYPDVDIKHEGLSVESLPGYDLFITTKTFQLPFLENYLGADHVEYVPHGFVDSIHRPTWVGGGDIAYRSDLLHAGTRSEYKQRWLEQLLERDPSLDLLVAGRGWDAIPLGGRQPTANTARSRSSVAYAETIQTSRVNIAIHAGPTASGQQDFVSTRTFEIPACAGFMLHIDNIEVREFFTPGVEIDVFSDVEELHEKIAFYISRQDLRLAMIARAYNRCVPSYGYCARAGLISKLIRDRLSR